MPAVFQQLWLRQTEDSVLGFQWSSVWPTALKI